MQKRSCEGGEAERLLAYTMTTLKLLQESSYYTDKKKKKKTPAALLGSQNTKNNNLDTLILCHPNTLPVNCRIQGGVKAACSLGFLVNLELFIIKSCTELVLPPTSAQSLQQSGVTKH